MSKKFFVYCLYSEYHDMIYIGQSDNLARRLKQHEKGKVSSTKPYRPYKLVYFEECPDRNSAVQKERFFKGTTGRRFLKELIK